MEKNLDLKYEKITFLNIFIILLVFFGNQTLSKGLKGECLKDLKFYKLIWKIYEWFRIVLKYGFWT